jgi:hypothetical protein
LSHSSGSIASLNHEEGGRVTLTNSSQVEPYGVDVSLGDNVRGFISNIHLGDAAKRSSKAAQRSAQFRVGATIACRALEVCTRESATDDAYYCRAVLVPLSRTLTLFAEAESAAF